jgi:hypothetical protein
LFPEGEKVNTFMLVASLFFAVLFFISIYVEWSDGEELRAVITLIFGLLCCIAAFWFAFIG